MRDVSGDQEFLDLRAMSARFGRDRLRTQAAGGNTSIKREGVMWVKASGFWLSDAADKDIFVPVALDGLRAAARRNDPAADSATSFVIGELNPAGLRPSIETSVHAIRDHAVVSHIHCVETIALAVLSDASDRIADRLRGLEGVRWSFVPYRRPGLPLARAILEFASPEANVLILGNHGLVVSGETVAEVESLTDRVCHALAAAPREAPAADLVALEASLCDTDYRLPTNSGAHALGLDRTSLALGSGASLYPDHVIFLGAGVAIARDVPRGTAISANGAAPPKMLVLPGSGVVLHRSTNASADALALCLADVLSRVPAGARLNRLTGPEEFALTNWEAEKYRQALSAATIPG